MKLILSALPQALFYPVVFLLPTAAVKSDEGSAFFESKIRPILIESCYDCHSAEGKHKGGLSLDTKEGVLKGGETGAAVVPGDTAKSLLLTAVRHTDPDLAMPPKKKLSDAQIADLERWVVMGAPDPRSGAKPATKLEEHFATAKTHWSFQKVIQPAVPAVPGATHPIDAFIREKLASAKLAKEKPGQTLQATALVHDAYIRLVNVEQSRHWNSRGHFFAAAAEAMRRILVEQARRKKRLRHGGDVQRLAFEDPAAPNDEERLLALHDALEKLARDDPAAAKVVELRHFAGLGHEQVASTLGITVYQARKKWTYARAWLRLAMQGKAD